LSRGDNGGAPGKRTWDVSLPRSFNLRALWASSDGGVHSSTSYTSASPSWSSFYNSIPISHVTGIDVVNASGGIQVYANTWDSGLALGFDDNSGGAFGWTRGVGTPGDGSRVLASPGFDTVVWATEGLGNTGYMSTDNFSSGTVALGRGSFLVHDQVPPVFLYNYGSGTEIDVATSPNNPPVTWTKFADGPASTSEYSTFGVGKWNGTGSYVYVGPFNDGIWVAPPGSTTFTRTSAPTLNYVKIHGWMSDDGTAPQTAYAFSVGGPITVLRTRDGGTTWKTITGDLPSTIYLEDIIADPVNPDIVFVSASFGANGIYMTTNASATTPHWARWVAGLPAGGSYAPADPSNLSSASVSFATLNLGGGGNWLYAGFWGGSVWKRRTDAHD